MNRDQRGIVCKRIDSIANERCQQVVRTKDAAVAALVPPIVTYASWLEKNKSSREELLKAAIAQVKLIAETSPLSGYMQLMISVNPLTVASEKGPRSWLPKGYVELCRKYVDDVHELTSKCDAVCANIRKQAEVLKVRIMLLGMPEAVLRMLDDFEHGKDIEG